jgi:hypothetical protein
MAVATSITLRSTLPVSDQTRDLVCKPSVAFGIYLIRFLLKP